LFSETGAAHPAPIHHVKLLFDFSRRTAPGSQELGLNIIIYKMNMLLL